MSPQQRQAAGSQYGGWLHPGDGALATAMDVEVRQVEAAAFRTDLERPFEYVLDFDFTENRVQLCGVNLVAELALAPAWRAVLWTSAEDDPFRGVLENLLRVVVAYRMVAEAGAVLHAAGFARRGRALVCYGASGAGKTTTARLAGGAGLDVLSDDLVAVRPAERGPVAVRLPFCGDLGAVADGPVAHPLGALCRLIQSPRHLARPDSPALAVAALTVHAPSVNLDPWRRERLVDNLEALVAAVPCLALEFTRDAGFLAVVDAALEPVPPA
jgi:hypothetical protein